MGRINILNPILSNMIAAGEVVERPSNIVKELVENSIDAKSKNISIYCENGGISLIKVIDDGVGMDHDDINACFYQHATSKISDELDLSRIMTLGFRGEAIASIASVSKTEILSKQKDDLGYSVRYRFGKKMSDEVAVIKDGTTVTVTDLFINTPVRLKYLKSPEKEFASISYLVDKLALTNLDISFSLYNDNKLVFKSTGNNDINSVIGTIYGLDACKKLNEVSFNEKGFSGKFYYVKPEIYRSNKLHMTYIINGRYVRNNSINDAICEAFNEYLPINKYPIVILYLDIDPLLIDVNIHPKKAEIRISDEKSICQRLKEILRESINSISHVHTEVIKPVNIVDYSSVLDTNININNNVLKDNNSLFNEIVKDKKEINNINISNNNILKEEIIENVIEVKEELLDLNIIGFFRDTYILASRNDGLYLIDQHAAAERIKYEYYLKELSNPKILRYELIVPVSIELSKLEFDFAVNNFSEFKKLGFVLDEFSNNTIVVREVPLWAQKKDIYDILIDMLSKMIKDKNVSIIEYRDTLCKQISCKASIRANDKISILEAKTLLSDLFKCENPYHCPHGRPTIIKFSDDDIKKMFERVQS